ncbi:ClpP/crotonase-like domain-containing protein [Schizophyllum commune]
MLATASRTALRARPFARPCVGASKGVRRLHPLAGQWDPPSANLVPMVIEQTGRGERSYDIFSRLLRERVVMLYGPIRDTDSALIVSQLLFLEAEETSKPIHLYINSPGGSVTAGLAIYDTMQYVSSPIHTYCIGCAASMGSLLLAAGEKGKRHCLPNASIMIHPSNAIPRTLRRRIRSSQRRRHSREGDPSQRALERDYFMTAKEAIDFGIVDGILEKRPTTAN